MPDELLQSTGADTIAPSTPGPAIGDQDVALPTTPAASTTPAATQQALPADAAMVPSYRLREVSERATREFQTAQAQWAQREAQYAAYLEQLQNQLRALVGVTPQEDSNISSIRQQFGQVYPGLSRLEERVDDLLRLTERADDFDSQQQHYWQQYGWQSMNRLYSLAEKTFGTALSEDGKRGLHASFLGYVSSDPNLTERYQNDPTLVDDFWRSFSSNFIDPARRMAAATVQQSTGGRTLPQDTPSGSVATSQSIKPANIDERATAAWESYKARIGNK